MRKSLADALGSELRSVYDSAAPSGPYKKTSEEASCCCGHVDVEGGKRRYATLALRCFQNPLDMILHLSYDSG